MSNTERHRRHFLKSWKAAINQLGPELFHVRSATVDGATDREELRPNPEAIERYVNTEHGHHYFLFSVISFFSHALIEDIFATAGIHCPRLPDLHHLDATEREILYLLIESYEGW